MIISLSAKANAGKDTVADHLVSKHNFVKIALADPIKRIARDLYNFSEPQLWGPSQMRNAPDVRYIRTTYARHSWRENSDSETEDDRWFCEQCDFTIGKLRTAEREKLGHECLVYLTPRYVCQLLGTEVGRNCYLNTWVDKGISIARTLLISNQWDYSGPQGLFPRKDTSFHYSGVVITDCRFRNEIDAFHAAKGNVVRIDRPQAGLKGLAAEHQSERDLDGLSPSDFDGVLHNTSTLEALYEQVDALVAAMKRATT